MLNHLVTLAALHKQRGLTTVEYAIAGGLVAAGVVAAFILLGTNVKGLIDFINGQL